LIQSVKNIKVERGLVRSVITDKDTHEIGFLVNGAGNGTKKLRKWQVSTYQFKISI
jgi:L-2-hydroxyglutarate oxidase LhgO